MASARNGETRLFWREDGEGPPLLLLNSVGCDATLWDGVLPHLSGFRVLRMNMRGHGLSDAPQGNYTLGDLAGDALAVLDRAKVEKAHICGLSLGGMVAMALALKAPQRVSSLVLACTSAKMDPASWNARILAVRKDGMAAVADAVMARFFSKEFCRDHPAQVEAVRARFLALDPQGYAGCCAAIRDMALMEKIGAIRAPTVVIAGTKDVATPYESHGSEIRKRIEGARAALLDCAHIAPVEMPEAFAAAVKEFVLGVSNA